MSIEPSSRQRSAKTITRSFSSTATHTPGPWRRHRSKPLMMAPHARRQLNGHRPYLGAHTKNSVIKKRGCDDDGCLRSDLDAIWPCRYVATLFGTPPVRVNSTMARRSFALTTCKHWECSTCQVLAASDGENSDENEDDLSPEDDHGATRPSRPYV